MNRTYLIVAVLAIVIVGAIMFYPRQNYDELAKCMTSKGIKMYGATWCPHCQNEKQMFGDSWQYIDYVECAEGSGVAAECSGENITAFPTWQFPNGKLVGELSIDKLQRLSGCGTP